MKKHKEIRIQMEQLGKSKNVEVKPLPVITLNINKHFFF